MASRKTEVFVASAMYSQSALSDLRYALSDIFSIASCAFFSRMPQLLGHALATMTNEIGTPDPN